MDDLAGVKGVVTGAAKVAGTALVGGIGMVLAKEGAERLGKEAAAKLAPRGAQKLLGQGVRRFGGDQAAQHFAKHSGEIAQTLGRKSYNLANYLDDANHVIRNGEWVPEMNGYVRLVGGEGSAKAAFVGVNRTSGNITTFHIKSVQELSRRAPSLGWSP